MAIEFSEIYGTLKSRVRNPFFASFILSWLIINWQVTFGIWVLDGKELKTMGYHNLIHYIGCKVNWRNGFWQPLFMGGLVAGATPFFIAGYKIIKARAEDWYTRDQKKDSEKRHISMIKYLELWENYDQKLDQLQKAIEKAEIYKDERENLQTDLFLKDETITKERLNRQMAEEKLRNSEIQISALQVQLATALDTKEYPVWMDGTFFMKISRGQEIIKERIKIEKSNVNRINETGELEPFLSIYLPRIIDENKYITFSLLAVSGSSNNYPLFGVVKLHRNEEGADGARGTIIMSTGQYIFELFENGPRT